MRRSGDAGYRDHPEWFITDDYQPVTEQSVQRAGQPGGGDEHHSVYSVDGRAGNYSKNGECSVVESETGKLRAFVGALYSFYALYSSGEEAMLYGSIVTFLGWTLYGLVSPRFELKNKHS